MTLDNPPPELRPGLSCTATIVTAIATARSDAADPSDNHSRIRQTTPKTDRPPTRTKKKIEKEGVFTINNGVAAFRRVKTGITGTTDIEILEGLAENDEIVTGPYQVLRTLKDNTRIKMEKAP